MEKRLKSVGKYFRIIILMTIILSATTVWSQPTEISSLSSISDMAGHYRLTANVSGASHTTITGPFGTLEAAIDPNTKMPYKITGLKQPLFATVTGGTVKNLLFDGVAISNNKYNSALAVEEKFLNRHEFYRLLLNSNKKLAAFKHHIEL